MPIFEFVCRGCGQHFETLVQGASAPRCPACSSDELDKQISVFAVSVKGSTASRTTTPAAPCGACGDPRGPGSCSLN